MKRVIRSRCVNPAEAAKYDALQEKIEQEKPEIDSPPCPTWIRMTRDALDSHSLDHV